MPPTALYPAIADLDALARSLTPSSSMIGDSDAVLCSTVAPVGEIDNDLNALVEGIVDLEAAPGWVLRVAGPRVNEDVGGLTDTEYRRIIAGKRLAIASLGTGPDVFSVALALGGTPTGRIWTLYNESTELSCVHVSVLAPFDPSAGYLIRAGSVLRHALPVDAEATGAIYTDGDGIFDDSCFDGSTFADTIPIP